jgi:LL-diaminopimelate aminotransferase
MPRVNDHYLKLQAGYLFPEIERRVKAYVDAHAGAEVIRLGIGDVVLPLAKSVRDAMRGAIDELGTDEGFKGYGPDQGYAFLREAIGEHAYGERGVRVSPEEIFVSDGSKCDSANFQEIFAPDARVAVPDPVYPVYVDSNVMAGRSGAADGHGHYAGIVYLPCTERNGFTPRPPDEPVGLVYLCSPNNPTGTAASREALAEWIAWAHRCGAVLLYDAAYADYITDADVPRSIYEVEGAREVAVEFRSFSKGAGFTGLRCGWVVVPEELRGTDASGGAVGLWQLWKRRQSTKFNGASYPVQVGAAATYTAEGRAELREQVAYYMRNAARIRDGLGGAGLRVFGGRDAPYVWASTPEGTGSWDFFDRLLEDAQVVVTPGAGFGPAGEGYFRVSAFGRRDSVDEAVERIRKRVRV